jgi:transposase
VAFDVAKKKHAVAIAEGGRQGEVRFLGDVENRPLPIERTIKRLATRYDLLHVCFEAGPTGYGLYRQVQAFGHDCLVVAALIPKRAGERIKTNRRDAVTLARLHRAPLYGPAATDGLLPHGLRRNPEFIGGLSVGEPRRFVAGHV